MSLTLFTKRLGKLAADNSPMILTAIGVTGVVSTAFLAGKASFEAAEVLSMESSDIELREKVELVWKFYIPAAGVGLLTVTSIIGANRIGSRRAAAIAAAYSISEKAIQEYREKVIEKLGEKKEIAMRDEIAQERIARQPLSEGNVIVTGRGGVLCYDNYTGRYFYCDMETIKKAQNDVNYLIVNNFYASLNDFYDLIDLPRIRVGDEVGWVLEHLMGIRFSTTMSDDQRPCISIDFDVTPVREFWRLGQ